MGICRRSGFDGGGGFHPFTSPGPSDSTALRRTTPPSGRRPPAPVPSGGLPPPRRRPHRRLPPRGHSRDQGDLEGLVLHPADDPLGLPRPRPRCRPPLPCHRGLADRRPRRAGVAALQLRDGGVQPGEEATTRGLLLGRGPPGRPMVALERPPRLLLR